MELLLLEVNCTVHDKTKNKVRCYDKSNNNNNSNININKILI